MNKKILFIVMSILVILSLSTVYSSDISEDSIDSGDDIAINEVTEQTNVQSEVTSKDNNIQSNKNIKQDASEVSVNSYAGMMSEINNAKSSTTPVVISLGPGDYNATGQITWGGSTNKNLTINGNGLILDGNNKYKFALVQMNNYLTLKNITLQNYKSTGPGGLIQCQGQINVADSTFINNTASRSSGGAINVQDFTGKHSTIDNCTFINNKALDGSAGAINVNMATLTITNSRFINNSVGGAISYGGAISNMGTLTIRDSYFESNYNPYIAGAIYTDNSLTVINTTFKNNSADRYAGAIYEGNNMLNISKCNFENNHASTGGAINTAKGNINITESNFINNSAQTGGVIYTEGSININSTVFDANNATNAAVLYASKATVSLINNTFKSNTAADETLYFDQSTPEMSDNNYEDTKIGYEDFTLTTDSQSVESGEQVTLNYPLTLTNPTFYQDLIAGSNYEIYINDENLQNSTENTDTLTMDNSGSFDVYVYNTALDIKTNTITIEVTSTPKLVVNPITAAIGDTITISAQIEQDGQIIDDLSMGKVSFKVNGKTLKDTNGKVIYTKVINGVATITDYVVPETWNKDSTIQAVYSGSSKCDKLTSEKTDITIVDDVSITTEDIQANAGSTITLKASITDNDKVINTGKIVFKINGKTVKDENGRVIYTKVSNNQVSLEYTLPDSYEAGTYNLTAVFISPDYDRLEDTKILTVI